jgi:uncharacterized delta-60 repeat protein
MKNIILYLSLTISFLVNIYPQVDTAWVKRYNGTGNSADIATGIVTDTEGNVYVTGSSIEDFGATVACTTIKYASSGTVEWIKYYKSAYGGIDVGNAIAIDNFNNIYVAGSSGAGYYYLIIKYNANGDTSWVRLFDDDVPGPFHHAYAISVDDEGNVYVTGESPGNTTYQDYVTLKYNSAGELQWAARYDGPAQFGIDKAVAITTDSEGNVYVNGKSDGSGSYEDYATIKYNSLGVEQWVARYNGPGNASDAALGIAVDDTGNVYVTGYSNGIGTYRDYATIKYNSSGVEQWVQRPVLPSEIARAIAIDHQGFIYVTGTGINGDYATIKYTPSGGQQWIATYNAVGLDEAYQICVDNEDNIYVTGTSEGTGTNMDYATVKYNSSGIEQWTARYNGPSNALDEAIGVAVDTAGNVYITGHSKGVNQNFDYLTIKYSQGTIGVEDVLQIPKFYQLCQNYPNPFNPSTRIQYQVPSISQVTLKVYDVLGNEVATLVNEEKPAGRYEVEFNPASGIRNLPASRQGLASGIYFCRLQTENYSKTIKMLYLK